MTTATRAKKAWQPAEDDRLATLAGYADLATIAVELGRSRVAVRQRRRRLGLSPMNGARTPAERGLCLREVATLLGTTRKAIRRLIASGALEGHQSADRISNGAIWRVHPSALATFLRERPERYDAATIADPAWRAIATGPRRRASLAGERLLSSAEVAPRLFLSPAGVTTAIRRGDLQAVLCRNRRGTAWYVLESSVRDYRPPTITGRKGFDAETVARRSRALDDAYRALLVGVAPTPTCEREGCTNPGEPCWLPVDPEDAPSYHYCAEHMYDEGFCPGCHLFWSGVETFDFSPLKLCDNCASQVEDDDDLEDDDLAWMGLPDLDELEARPS